MAINVVIFSVMMPYGRIQTFRRTGLPRIPLKWKN